ncbi:MAG: hypothetical protein GY778_16320, partial [bacterium]|nr:hypothetical protein [bacterium]
MREALLLTLIVATASTTPGDSGREASPDGQWLREWLVLEPTGRRGRDPIQVDGLTYELARAGSLRPVVGGRVVSVDGEQRQWSTATAGEDGWLQGPALRGGHAAVAVRSEAPRTVLLEATGHSVVYCNGVPRAGDPYGTGFVRLPVRLHAGDNTLLFRVGRGRVRARLMPLRAEALLNAGDMTLPDAVVGEGGDLVGAGVVINGSSQRLNDAWIVAQVDGAEPVRTAVPSIERLTVRKVAFRFQVPPGAPPGELALRIQLHRGADEADPPLDSADVKVQVRSADEVYKRTFVSAIDGGVQYYAVRRATEAGQQGLFLTLHGASVEAVGQDRAYASKSWGHIVAPTNRRPFGFDWEDWGRLDALEAFEHAARRYGVNRQRTWLTGHSMGGHGTWHLGMTFPDLFA